jgi:hypothetical protein
MFSSEWQRPNCVSTDFTVFVQTRRGEKARCRRSTEITWHEIQSDVNSESVTLVAEASPPWAGMPVTGPRCSVGGAILRPAPVKRHVDNEGTADDRNWPKE